MKTAEEFLKQNYTVTYRHLANGDGNNIKAFAIYEAMEEYANQSKWISVEDRLPEKEPKKYTNMSINVLGLTKEFPTQIECWYDFDSKEWDSQLIGLKDKLTITHWQPLQK